MLDFQEKNTVPQEGLSKTHLCEFTPKSLMLHETNFMRLHRLNDYNSQKFVDLFPKTKNLNPKDFVFFVSTKGK